jgi:3-deoxy-manno-octulosonate cytidylyltransferase (CMP-KDO synthetase)
MKAIGIIPARYGSTRFRGKPLKLIAGKILVERVWERAMNARSLDQVIIATDDIRIKKAMEDIGAVVIMTSKSASSGTDRVNEAAKKLGNDAEIILNIQGDEPLIDPGLISNIADTLRQNKDIDIVSACYPLKKPYDMENTNVVKVVLDQKGFALYFSRYPIPFRRAGGKKACYKHLGIYGFRREFLSRFASWNQTPLERSEKLEQLRILEKGYKIKMIISEQDSVGVDEKEDVGKVERMISQESKG